jgi:hypothetical protein
MAGKPDAPPAPTYLSSTDSTITVQLYRTLEANGAPIERYEVWRDGGADDDLGIQTNQTTYDGHAMTFELAGLQTGVIYKIAAVAVNSQGDSVKSDYVLIAATELPQAPSLIEKDRLISTQSSLHVSWTESAATATPITGYILEMAPFGSFSFQTVYAGTNKPG